MDKRINNLHRGKLNHLSSLAVTLEQRIRTTVVIVRRCAEQRATFCPENGQKDPVVHHRDEFSLIRGIFSDDAGKRLSVEF